MKACEVHNRGDIVGAMGDMNAFFIVEARNVVPKAAR